MRLTIRDTRVQSTAKNDPWLWGSALKYTIVYVNWVEKVTKVGAHPQKGSYMVSSLIAVNEMHGDDNKAPTEIAKTTLGHPDD